MTRISIICAAVSTLAVLILSASSASAGSVNIPNTKVIVHTPPPPPPKLNNVINKTQGTQIGFPALDAGSKDAAKMTIKLAPEKLEAGSENIKRTKTYTGCRGCASSQR